MRILRSCLVALVAVAVGCAAILATVRIQDGLVESEVSMTSPAVDAAPTAPPAPPVSPVTSTTAPTLGSLSPEELAAFSVYVTPTTSTAPSTSTPPTTIATPPTSVYSPPTTTWVEPEPEPEPAYVASGSGCVIPAYICQRESGMSYTALNASSGAGGMYQFMPSTWNAVARAIAPGWVGTPPHAAPPSVQDQFAAHLWDGGRGCFHWTTC